MIFKMVETEQPNGGFNHGVSLFLDGESDKQDAVIVSGVAHDAAWSLYMDLNAALNRAGLAVQTKNKAANDSVTPEAIANIKVLELRNVALQVEVKKWKKYYYIAAGFLVLSQWLYLFMPIR